MYRALFLYIAEIIKYIKPATIAEIGIVTIQANNKFLVTPHRTALNLFVAPTPIIAPVIVCVVLTGIPI